MKALIAISLALLAANAPETLGAANIAKIPNSLRQTYADGTMTELSCQPGSASLKSCELHVIDRKGAKTYAIDSGDYRLDLYLSQYWFWSGPSSADFTVAVPVACLPTDTAHLPEDRRDHVECRLFLSPSSDRLAPTRLKVSDPDGAPVTGLGPNHSFKPKPLRGSA